MTTSLRICLLAAISFLSLQAGAHPAIRATSTPVWETLPPTPTLPGNPTGTKASINGIQIWHAQFGVKNSSALPVLLLHGGFGSSNYWSSVIEILMKKHYVIAMDARGQGRSTMDNTPYSFDLYAQDAGAVLKSLGISKAAWVGWSEGADTVLAALLNSSISPMVARGFTTGAWHNVDANNATYTDTDIYNTFITRASAEYRAFQPNGNLTALANALTVLEATQPTWTASDLGKITLGSKLTLSWGQYEEAIKLSEPATMHGYIQGSKLVIMENASHFVPLQDPAQFAAAIDNFMLAAPPSTMSRHYTPTSGAHQQKPLSKLVQTLTEPMRSGDISVGGTNRSELVVPRNAQKATRGPNVDKREERAPKSEEETVPLFREV